MKTINIPQEVRVKSVAVAMPLFVAWCMFLFSLVAVSSAAAENVIQESCGESNTGGTKVLLAYSSKHGTTADVAPAIATVLCSNGFQVDVAQARKVDSLSGYDAVIVGSPIYWATFLPGVRQFLKRFETTLATLPVAVFFLSTYVNESTGLVNPDAKGFFVDKVLAETPQITLTGDMGMFGGEFTFAELSPVELISMELSGYSDRDYRNAAVVTAWAEYISTVLAP